MISKSKYESSAHAVENALFYAQTPANDSLRYSMYTVDKKRYSLQFYKNTR